MNFFSLELILRLVNHFYQDLSWRDYPTGLGKNIDFGYTENTGKARRSLSDKGIDPIMVVKRDQ